MYVQLSDLHFHNWSAFAKTNDDGVNSRLRIILNETIRAAHKLKELRKAKGGTMVLGGDLFQAGHVV